MTDCVPQRTYIADPDFASDFLSPIPSGPRDWNALRRLLKTFKDILEGKSVNPVPRLISSFAATVKPGGILLTWNEVKYGFAYNIYRARTNDFTKARVIYTAHDGLGNKFSFFDKFGQDVPGAVRFYWIEGFNIDIKVGPRTGPVVSAEAT